MTLGSIVVLFLGVSVLYLLFFTFLFMFFFFRNLTNSLSTRYSSNCGGLSHLQKKVMQFLHYFCSMLFFFPPVFCSPPVLLPKNPSVKTKIRRILRCSCPTPKFGVPMDKLCPKIGRVTWPYLGYYGAIMVARDDVFSY